MIKDKLFRKLVMELGGIKVPSDYEYLPLWCKLRKGMPIDEMVEELRNRGYPLFEDANQLYEYIINH